MKKIFLFLAMMVISSLSFAQSQPTDCKTGIERCGPQVKPPGCPPGKHWSNKEKGYSRCVSDVPPPGSCSNGATNYPTCGCENGNIDYPYCTKPKPPLDSLCTNGANNYPSCIKYLTVQVGYSQPDIGVVGSIDICRKYGYSYVGGSLCDPNISVGSDHIYWTFVPKSSIALYVEIGTDAIPLSCVIGGSGCNSYYSQYFQQAQSLRNRSSLLLFISTYTDDSQFFGHGSAFVKKGELINVFTRDEDQSLKYYASEDGWVFYEVKVRGGD